MAARLANAICLPCEAIIKGCDKGCMYMGKACDSMCGCCEKGCSGCMDWFEEALSQPYAMCVSFTVLANLGPALGFVYFLIQGWGSTEKYNCPHPMDIWLLVMMGLWLCNTLFGWYLFNRLNKQNDEDDDPNLSPARNEYNRACKFFMYDPVVCVYIIVILFAFVWSMLGFSWRGGNLSVLECATNTFEYLEVCKWASIIMLAFIGIGLLCIVGSLMRNQIEDNECLKCMCCCLFILPCHQSDEERERRREERRARHAQGNDLSNQYSVPIAQPQVPLAQPSRPVAQPSLPVAQPSMHSNNVGIDAPPAYPQTNPYQSNSYGQQPQYVHQAVPAPQPYVQQPQPSYQAAQPLPASGPYASQQQQEKSTAEEAKEAAKNAAKATGKLASEWGSKGMAWAKGKAGKK